MTIFGSLLRDHRLAADLTQVEMAKKLRISQEYLSRLELGKNAPKPAQLLKAAAILGLKGEPLHRFVFEGYLAHVPKFGHEMMRRAAGFR